MKEIKTLDFKGIITTPQLHEYLAMELSFPEFYGNNWDAFWDSITGIIEMPKQLDIYNFKSLKEKLPRGANLFKDCVNDFIEEKISETTFNFKS